MIIVGVTPGASLSSDGRTFRYGVLIPVSEVRLCLDEWNHRQRKFRFAGKHII